MGVLVGIAGEYLDKLELSHYKCDVDQDHYCYAQQYGDGDGEEHARIREIKLVLDTPST